MSTLDRIRPTIEGPVRELGLVVEDVNVTPAGKRRLVRVSVDRDVAALDAADDRSPVEPLTLDEVAEATRALSAALDDSDAMGDAPYVLEVTSPGVDRPLTEPRHFRRNVGRLVLLTLRDGSTVTGRIVAAGAQGVTVAVEATKDSPAREQQLSHADIARAQVQVEFSRGAHEEDD